MALFTRSLTVAEQLANVLHQAMAEDDAASAALDEINEEIDALYDEEADIRAEQQTTRNIIAGLNSLLG